MASHSLVTALYRHIRIPTISIIANIPFKNHDG